MLREGGTLLLDARYGKFDTTRGLVDCIGKKRKKNNLILSIFKRRTSATTLTLPPTTALSVALMETMRRKNTGNKNKGCTSCGSDLQELPRIRPM